MSKFIEIVPGIEVRPEYVIKKSVVSYNGKLIYKIKVKEDKEYEVTKQVFDSIK